jgi:predicted small secreted protein
MKTYGEKIALAAVLAAAALVSACNTVEGAGRDVKSAGDAIEDTARDVKD